MNVRTVTARTGSRTYLQNIYIAVSITNACSYCVHSHTAAARAKGMTEEMYADLLRVVATAGRTNQLLNGLQVPVDVAFRQELHGGSAQD